MRFVDEYRSNEKVQTLLEAIRKKVTRPWYIMEICGGQTHAIARYRLEEMLPPDLQLLHGPGCPVCVTPVETIDYALKLATQPNVILASFGDMMRVPGSKEDLLSVKARGADIRMLYTPLDALSLAEENPDKEIVFVDEIKGEVKLPHGFERGHTPRTSELFHIDFLIHGTTRYRGYLIRSGKQSEWLPDSRTCLRHHRQQGLSPISRPL